MARSNVLAFVPSYSQCDEHGEYQANVNAPDGERWISGCPRCETRHTTAKAFDRAQIPPRFASKSFANFNTVTDSDRCALDTCKAYADDFVAALDAGKCLIFAGVPGTGKTHLACAIANSIISSGHSALFTTAGDLIRQIRATWNRQSEKTEEQIIRELAAIDLLLIDEVGVQHGTESERILLFEVINRRYEQIKPTLIISNLPIKSSDGLCLKDFLGARAFDRLRENGGKLIQFSGASKRGGMPQ